MSLVSLPNAQPSDEMLLETARVNPEAFGAFYDRHFDNVVAYFFKRTSDPHLSADLTAETFAEALRSLRRYNTKKGTPSAWLFGIGRNQLRRHLRSRGIHHRALAKLRMIDLTFTHDLDIEEIESSIDLAAQMPLLNNGLDQLSPLLRTAVVLRVANNLSFEELAVALDCSPGTARQRVSRGLMQLHEFLANDE